MSRFPRFPLYAVAAVGLAAAGCASHFEPIMVTRDASAVANCEKVADLDAQQNVRYDDTDPELRLQQEAREKGANTVLISDSEGRKGVAYRCSMPPATAPAASGSGH
jgi:hypothetical protein